MRSELESLRVKKVKHSFPICPVAFKASPLASRTLPTRSVATLLEYFVMVGSGSIGFFKFFCTEMLFRCVKQAQNTPEERYVDAGMKIQVKNGEKPAMALLFV